MEIETKKKIVSQKQKMAIKAIEEYVGFVPKFAGDLDDYEAVSDYLTKYLKFLYNNTWAVINGY